MGHFLLVREARECGKRSESDSDSKEETSLFPILGRAENCGQIPAQGRAANELNLTEYLSEYVTTTLPPSTSKEGIE